MAGNFETLIFICHNFSGLFFTQKGRGKEIHNIEVFLPHMLMSPVLKCKNVLFNGVCIHIFERYIDDLNILHSIFKI